MNSRFIVIFLKMFGFSLKVALIPKQLMIEELTPTGANYRNQIAKIRHWRIIELMVIIETSIFTKYIKQLMSDEQYRELQEALVNRPDLGDLIRGSGGLRKVRWKLESTGKSGGVRVIYYWVVNDDQLRMLYVYPKGKQENLTSNQLAALKAIVERW